ncbi:MAG: tRNA epoxyqueuosine(34) reductase QueG [Terriglobia bacterium]
MDLRSAIKDRAIEVGFDLVGISPATPGRDLDIAREWVERGYGGEMRYLANPKRFDPRSVLPSVKSVVCVGLVYNTPFVYSEEVRRQKSEARSQKPEGQTAMPSPSGRGWPRGASSGAGEGSDLRSSSFDFRFSNFEPPVSNFQFPVSGENGGRDAHAPRGWVSRYAWGRDYHEVMREKLERLRAAIEELSPAVETRVYVDTGPVVERAFARFSGLGWMGKNACIINEEKGSWFFLGVILTNLALEPDLPAPDRCGSCRACLDACPTGALVEPYVMDARRCISYLTIELKGAIPSELRAGVGVNIFGCDICQDVCPWNGKNRIQKSEARSQENGFQPSAVSFQRSAVSGQLSADGSQPPANFQFSISNFQSSASSPQSLAPTPHSSITNHNSQITNTPDPRQPTPETFSLFAPPLDELAAISEDEFRNAFRHSPIKRAKYRGWLRNLCVAMGNSGNARLVPKLQELAQHPDPVIREHAEWALDRINRAS